MLKLIRTDMLLFFDMLRQIKDCMDCCNYDVSELFSEFTDEPDECECIANEALTCCPYFKDFDWQYYECDMDLPEEDRETWGEMWSFSDENMKNFYKLLNELLKSGKINKTEFNLHKSEMEGFIHENILEKQEYYGIGYELIFAEKEDESDCIKVYLDYTSGFSQFILYCGIIQIFDKFKTKLRELKEAYCNREELLEAA